jgi:hypothetical protein
MKLRSLRPLSLSKRAGSVERLPFVGSEKFFVKRVKNPYLKLSIYMSGKIAVYAVIK